MCGGVNICMLGSFSNSTSIEAREKKKEEETKTNNNKSTRLVSNGQHELQRNS